MWQNLQQQWIYHLHLSDSSPEASHLPLGRGVLNLPQILGMVKQTYHGPMILEGPSVLSKPQEINKGMSLLKKWLA